MNIVFSRDVAEALKDRYTVLELEPREVEGITIEAFCVIEASQIPLTELPMLDHWVKLHNAFVQANKEKNGKLCLDLEVHLTGKFGGELDEFYHIVCNRFKQVD